MIALSLSTDHRATLAALRAVEPWADGTAEEIAAGCALLDVREGGRLVGAFAVEKRGTVATIKAAAVQSAHAWAIYSELEQGLRLAGVRTVGAFTQRPGLVRRLQRRGYVAQPAPAGFTELTRTL